MTKTLTEQWKDGELEYGYYYIDFGIGGVPMLFNGLEFYCERTQKPNAIKTILAPVPSYGSLYNPNDGRIPVGLFTVLKLIKRDIEQYQKIRHLTDLECGIKSQVVSLLKRWGIK